MSWWRTHARGAAGRSRFRWCSTRRSACGWKGSSRRFPTSILPGRQAWTRLAQNGLSLDRRAAVSGRSARPGVRQESSLLRRGGLVPARARRAGRTGAAALVRRARRHLPGALRDVRVEQPGGALGKAARPRRRAGRIAPSAAAMPAATSAARPPAPPLAAPAPSTARASQAGRQQLARHDHARSVRRRPAGRGSPGRCRRRPRPKPRSAPEPVAIASSSQRSAGDPFAAGIGAAARPAGICLPAAQAGPLSALPGQRRARAVAVRAACRRRSAKRSSCKRPSRADLACLQRELAIRCPVTALVVGMHQERGFRELVRRVGRERAVAQRFGRRFDVRIVPTAEAIGNLCALAAGVFEDWIHTLFREAEALARPGNLRLYGLLVQDPLDAFERAQRGARRRRLPTIRRARSCPSRSRSAAATLPRPARATTSRRSCAASLRS